MDNFNLKDQKKFDEFVRGIVVHLKKLQMGKIKNIGSGGSIYCVTATFIPYEMFDGEYGEYKHKSASSSAIKPEEVLKKFNKFYVRMCEALLGNNFNRPAKRYLQPITYAFIDMPGTSKKKKKVLSAFEKLKAKKGLIGPPPDRTGHIHIVMFVHPDIKDKFEDLRKRKIFQEIYFNLETSNMTLDITKPRKPLVHWVGYSAKYLRNPSEEHKDKDLYMMFPKALSE